MTLEGHAEVLKLARLLGASGERLQYLEALDPSEVRMLRERATVVLYEGDRRFARVALASRIPPAPMTAWIAQHLFGALLCARVTGLLDPARAVAIAERLPPTFLADLAMQLDPRRARAIILRLPAALIAKVAALLTRRGEHIVMGRFVGHMTDAALRASFEVIDDASLLRISYFVEEKDQLGHVVDLLANDRVRGAIRAATDADLWPQALDLLTRVPAEQAAWLADMAAGEEDHVLEGLARCAQRDGLWDVVLPVSRNMSDAGGERFATLTALHEPEILAAIVDAAVAGDLLDDLLPLMKLLPGEARAVVNERLARRVGTAPQARRAGGLGD